MFAHHFFLFKSREHKPVGHGSAISASISSHAEHFLISALKPSSSIDTVRVKYLPRLWSLRRGQRRACLLLCYFGVACGWLAKPTCSADCCGSLIFSIKSVRESWRRKGGHAIQHIRSVSTTWKRSGDTHGLGVHYVVFSLIMRSSSLARPSLVPLVNKSARVPVIFAGLRVTSVNDIAAEPAEG